MHCYFIQSTIQPQYIDSLSKQDDSPAERIQKLVEKSVVLWDEENDAVGAEKALLSAMAIEGGDRDVDVLISYGILQQEAFDNLVPTLHPILS